jgi:hypothetical protein
LVLERQLVWDIWFVTSACFYVIYQSLRVTWWL